MGGEATDGGQQSKLTGRRHRKNNIMIFGLEDRKDKGYFNTLGAVK
jgi:hypothetical protein